MLKKSFCFFAAVCTIVPFIVLAQNLDCIVLHDSSKMLISGNWSSAYLSQEEGRVDYIGLITSIFDKKAKSTETGKVFLPIDGCTEKKGSLLFTDMSNQIFQQVDYNFDILSAASNYAKSVCKNIVENRQAIDNLPKHLEGVNEN